VFKVIGEVIRKLREKKGLGVNELACMIGISGPYLSQIESGKRKNPSYEVLAKIANALDVHIGDLIQEDADKFIIDNIAKEAKKAGIDLNDADVLDKLGSEIQNKISTTLIEHLAKTIRHEKPKPDNNIDISSMHKLEKVRMVPMVGKVAAGVPVMAEEHIEGYMPIDMCFLDPNKDYYLLKVKGDSMNLEFPDGTWVLVEKTDCIENGQLGVVLVDAEEATIKKVVFNRNMVTLIPMSTNPVYQPIMYDLEKDDVRIQGRVVMALKTY